MQLQVIKLFEVAKLQNTIVFGLNDKPITGIKTIPRLVMGSGPSITLNLT